MPLRNVIIYFVCTCNSSFTTYCSPSRFERDPALIAVEQKLKEGVPMPPEIKLALERLRKWQRMKPMNYLREEGEESHAYLQRLIKHYSSQEIYEERLNLLAKEWKTRYMDGLKKVYGNTIFCS